VEKIKAADPQGIFYEYPAGHGFNCDQRAAFNSEAAALARARTLEFFGRKLTGKEQ
jgi:carboxymethylenebutenolidase